MNHAHSCGSFVLATLSSSNVLSVQPLISPSFIFRSFIDGDSILLSLSLFCFLSGLTGSLFEKCSILMFGIGGESWYLNQETLISLFFPPALAESVANSVHCRKRLEPKHTPTIIWIDSHIPVERNNTSIIHDRNWTLSS